jgi:prephenate dehydratase
MVLILLRLSQGQLKVEPFEYVFYIDFEFSKKDLNRVLDALEEFKKLVKRYKFLGFYPIN